MFWFGDSAIGWRYNLKKFPGEILQGLADNIPLCCCLYYTFIKTVCLLIHAIRNPRFIFKGFRTWGSSTGHKTVDGILFIMFTDAYRLDNGFIFSPGFQKLDYWRCPVCRLIDKRKELDWTTNAFWDLAYCRREVNK